MTDETTIRILGFAGSLRSASVNRGLLRAAADAAPEGVEIEAFDLKPIPLFDQDVEDAGDPEPVVAFKRAIEDADALLIACPEYNYGITGVLKNAIDWASRPSSDPPIGEKLVALMGATPGGFGTVRGQLQARQALLGAGARVLDRPQVYVARAKDRFDDKGHLVDDDTQGYVEKLVAALVEASAIGPSGGMIEIGVRLAAGVFLVLAERHHGRFPVIDDSLEVPLDLEGDRA